MILLSFYILTGFTQGIRMVAYSLGKIMGPILVSSLLNRLPLLTSINLGLYVLVLVRKTFVYVHSCRLFASV